MKVGDIIVNPWVSEYFNGKLNPNYATIYIGNNRSIDYKGQKYSWGDKVYKHNPEEKTPWKVIGHIDIKGIIVEAIDDAVREDDLQILCGELQTKEFDEVICGDKVEIVRCRDCKHRYGDECPMRHIEWVEYEEDGFMERDDIVHDHTVDDGFCNCGERESEA